MTFSPLSHPPTDEQLAIFDAAARPAGHLSVNAGAGCGKSSTLAAASRLVPRPGLALAFGRATTAGLREAFAPEWTVKSFNGLGHLAWARSPRCRVSGLKLDDRKVGKLVTQLARDQRMTLASDEWAATRECVALAQAAGLVPRGVVGEEVTLRPDSPTEWQTLALDAGADSRSAELVASLARSALIEDIRLAERGVVSYDDQVYCSAMLGGRFPQFLVVAVDEDQDLSPLQVRMLGLALARSGSVIAVGDTAQAIYAWRGASGKALELIKDAVGGEWLGLPLMTTFRCPERVVRRQLEHVPGFRARRGAPEGLVREGPRRWDTELGRWRDAEWSWEDLVALRPGVAPTVLCRNNAPLMTLAFKLLRRGIAVRVLGRDIGRGLVALVRRVAPAEGIPISVVIDAVRRWAENESTAARVAGLPHRLDGIADRAESLIAVASETEARDAGQLVRLIERLFAAEAGLVTLSSIHRAKGLEWDLVVHLDPWRVPSRQAKAALAAGDPEPMEQERNLRYVAETRTRWGLVLAGLAGLAPAREAGDSL